MKLTDDKFDELVSYVYSLWSKKYRVDFKKKRPEARLYGHKIKLTDQIEFVKLYLGFLMIDGKNKANLERIMKFLLLQNVNSKGKLEIHFVGGSPADVVVHVNKMKEIDCSDTHSLIQYDSIYILRRDKLWTKRSAAKMLEAIKYDLEFDGSTFNPAEINILNRAKEKELAFISCNID
jgi:hypothetical protein